MKAGDLIQLSSQFTAIEHGIILRRLIDSTLPHDWPRIIVLWNNGKIESMYEDDLVVINENR